jgi:predicted N-acetyltransferase YhbS
MSDRVLSPEVRRIPFADLTEALAQQVLALQGAVWPNDEEADSAVACADYLRGDRACPRRELFLIQAAGQVVAHAELFGRVIQAETQSFEVACLSSVCVLPSLQGQGLGKAVAQVALAKIDAGEFAVALFQTPVPGFYERLGARRIENVWVNSQSAQPTTYPWYDEFVMIYPAAYPWPAGTIDLNGPAF